MVMTIYSDSLTVPHEKDKDRISFLDLPHEIRLRIYHLLYLSSPVKNVGIAPWHSIQKCRTYTMQHIFAVGEDDKPEPLYTSPTPTSKLLSSDRPLCHIPTPLARSCRQIHAEASLIPFHENEFVFINWFSLGLSSALAFLQARGVRQRAELRFMRMEIFAQDLSSGSAKFADWVQLCGYLPGLRGFRLLVYMEGGAAYQTSGCTEVGTMEAGAAQVGEGEIQDAQELVCKNVEWIVKGLASLGNLRQLEVELVDVKWTAKQKLEWCAMLREVLQSSRKSQDVKVLCVEKLVCD